MKKFLKLSLILALSLVFMFTLFGCDKTEKEQSGEQTTGLVCEIEKDDDGEEYAIVEKYSLSEADALKVASGDYADLLVNLEINEYELDGKKYPIKEIKAGAFTNQMVIEKVTIGENVETVGSACFAGCTNLKEIKLNFIGNKADSLNQAKTFCYLFGTTTFTGSVAVSNMYASGSIASTYYLPEKLEKVIVTGNNIPGYAFYGTSVKEVEILGNVEYIGEYAFSTMSNLSKFTVPASVKEIGKNAFAFSTGLYNIDFSNATALTTIWQEAFSGCSMLGYGTNAVNLPNSVTKIYSGAFKNCTNLKSIDLTQTQITEIPSTCFYGCEKLTEVLYNDGVIVGNDAIPEVK